MAVPADFPRSDSLNVPETSTTMHNGYTDSLNGETACAHDSGAVTWDTLTFPGQDVAIAFCSAGDSPTSDATEWPDTTGLWVWRAAAFSLTRLLVERPHIVAGRRVVELAAGCALPSAAAVRLGAAFILATDASIATLPLASANLHANGLCDATCSYPESPRSAEVRFDADGISTFTQGGTRTPRSTAEPTPCAHTARLRWCCDADIEDARARHIEVANGVDVVLASDALWLRPYITDDIYVQAVELLSTATRILRHAQCEQATTAPLGSGAQAANPTSSQKCRTDCEAVTRAAPLCPIIVLSFVHRLGGMAADVQAAAEMLGLTSTVVSPPWGNGDSASHTHGDEQIASAPVGIMVVSRCPCCIAALPTILALNCSLSVAIEDETAASARRRSAMMRAEARIVAESAPARVNPLWCHPQPRAHNGASLPATRKLTEAREALARDAQRPTCQRSNPADARSGE